jgi:hypothetical protein
MLPWLRNFVAVASFWLSISACRLYTAATENISLQKFQYIVAGMIYYFPKFCTIYIPHYVYMGHVKGSAYWTQILRDDTNECRYATWSYNYNSKCVPVHN